MKIYEHSGAVPPTGAALALLTGAVASAALGIVYSFSFYYIPYVYLNFVLAVGFGAGSGFVVGQLARVGKIRNTSVVAGLAIIATAVGIYAEWGSTVYAMYPAEALAQLWAKAGLRTFEPWAIGRLMQGLFEEGSWGLTAGGNVRGWPLVAFWVIEAGLVLTSASKIATSQIADHPFCEACQQWVTSHTPHFYVGNGSESVWTDVQNGTFETLALTPRATGQEPTFVRLTLKSCDSCLNSRFLTVTACANTTDNKGNPKLEETNLAGNLILTTTQSEIVEAASMIAPQPGETPVEIPPTAGAWTLQSPAVSGEWTLQSQSVGPEKPAGV